MTVEPFSDELRDHLMTFWRSKCDLCAWTSRRLPFPDPDAALHALALHKAAAHEAGSTR